MTRSLSTPEARAIATRADTRWQAVVARDAAADGSFVFAVRTTGVYCHPSCASRRARPENVEFFDGGAQARLVGYRPCKRCRADRPRGGDDTVARVARLCRAIERASTVPTLSVLARLFGASATQTRRRFVRVVGMTPKQYAHAVRRRRVGQGLQKGGTVTEAFFGAGFNSSGRFYEQSEALLGMTPTQFKTGAAGQRIQYAVGTSSLSAVLVATTNRGVCAVLLGDDPRDLRRDLARRFPRAELVEAGRALAAQVQYVVRAVERPGDTTGLPLDIQGTAFQQRIWRGLSKLRAGSRITRAGLQSVTDPDAQVVATPYTKDALLGKIRDVLDAPAIEA